VKIIGYCEKCRRVKHVTVKWPNPRGVSIGVCDECRDGGK
jgi:hypothetical protein